MDLDVLSTPGHLISLAARGFARLSEARLKSLGFGVGHLPVLVALQDGRASTQRDLARSPRSSNRRWRRCLPAWSGTG
jgi:MarR family transcriptional regulator, transcriptional regulator for hemolysin